MQEWEEDIIHLKKDELDLLPLFPKQFGAFAVLRSQC